jgi:hypothetical protein
VLDSPLISDRYASVIAFVGELQRQDPLSDQILFVDTGEALGHDRPNPKVRRRQRRLLAR